MNPRPHTYSPAEALSMETSGFVHDSGLNASRDFLPLYFEELVLVHWHAIDFAGQNKHFLSEAFRDVDRLVVEAAVDRRSRRFRQLRKALPRLEQFLER